VFRSRSAQNIAPLETALSRETIPAIRAQIELSLAASRLASPDNAVRLQGINALAEVTDQNARALLLETKAQAPDLARQIDGAVAKIEGRLKVRQMVETFFQGLSLGSVLLLAALGLAVTFGVMGVINMEHGEMVMEG
jgi:urea transport system permease protein